MARFVNTSLLLIAVVGAVFAWLARSEYEATRRQHARLTAKVGRVPIQDPTKVHVLALDTGNPLDFKWHVHVPSNFPSKWALEHASGSSSSSTSGGPSSTALVRMRFREIDGQWRVWLQGMLGNYISSVPFGELLDQPGLLDIRQLGKGEVQVLDADQVASFLTINAEQESVPKDLGNPLLTFRFGTESAWAKHKSQGK